MKDFSRTLIELYDIAENVPINSFPHEAIRLMRPIFRFDGAVFGVGESLPRDKSNLVIDHAFVDECDHSILEDYGKISDQDPITKKFISGLSRPLCCDCQRFFRKAKLPAMEAFAYKHGLRQLMLYGTAANTSTLAQWLVMYRSSDICFTKRESNDLLMLWPHIERCITSNRVRHLERQIRWHESRAAALINRRGYIEAADPCFRDLLAMEWPSSSINKIPDQVLSRFHAGLSFVGARIRISLHVQEDFMVCKAYEKNLLSTLTPAELAVAQHFSSGLTHKDIARHLGVSQNTVRTHIKHVYDKLAIHDKARLAHLMATSFIQ